MSDTAPRPRTGSEGRSRERARRPPPWKGGPRVARPIAVVLAMLVLASGLVIPVVAAHAFVRGAVSTGRTAGPAAVARSRGAAAEAAGPAAPAAPFSVPSPSAAGWTDQYTLFLSNNTLRPGDVLSDQFREPRHMAYDPDLGVLFADGGGRVHVLDPTTLQVAGTLGSIAGGSLFYLPLTGWLYVESSGALLIVNPSNGSIVRSIPVPQASLAADGTLVYAPVQGELLVGNPFNSTLAVVNPTLGQVVNEVSVGTGFNGVVAGAYDAADHLIYLAIYETNRVLVVDPASWTVVKSIAIPSSDGLFATGVGVDPGTGNVFASSLFYCPGCFGSDSLVEISGTNQSVVASRALGSYTSGIAVTNGTVYVADSRRGSLFAVDASNLSSAREIPLVGSPALLYDQWFPLAVPALGRVYVPEGYAEAISGVAIQNASVAAVLYAEVRPGAIAWDGACGCYAVLGTLRQVVYLVDPVTLQVTRTIPLSGVPYDLAFDNGSGELFVTVAGFSASAPGVYAFDGANGTQVGFVSDSKSPWGIAVDPKNGRVFVADYLGNDVGVYAGATLAKLASIGTGNQTTQVLYAPGVDAVYASNWGSNTVTQIEPNVERAIATIGVGSAPTALASDDRGKVLYVGCLSSGNLTLINESQGTTVGSLRNVSAVSGMAFDPAAGELFVANSSGRIAVFNATGGSFGLPVGASTYQLLDRGGLLLATDTATGALYQLGPPVAPNVFPVEFTENHLPNGTSWGVTLSGGLNASGASSHLVFDLANGSYSYRVRDANASWGARAGSFRVAGLPLGVPVNFTPVTFPVTFRERGLPAGTNWSVSVGADAQSTRNTTLLFEETNGSLPFVTGSLVGYTAVPAHGQVVVSGGPATVNITFSSPANRPGSSPLPGWASLLLGGPLTVWLILGVVGVVAGAVATVVLCHRSARASAAPPPPGAPLPGPPKGPL